MCACVACKVNQRLLLFGVSSMRWCSSKIIEMLNVLHDLFLPFKLWWCSSLIKRPVLSSFSFDWRSKFFRVYTLLHAVFPSLTTFTCNVVTQRRCILQMFMAKQLRRRKARESPSTDSMFRKECTQNIYRCSFIPWLAPDEKETTRKKLQEET